MGPRVALRDGGVLAPIGGLGGGRKWGPLARHYQACCNKLIPYCRSRVLSATDPGGRLHFPDHPSSGGVGVLWTLQPPRMVCTPQNRPKPYDVSCKFL